MNKGKYVYSQVMTYFPRWVFEAAVEKYRGDFHAKNLNSYSIRASDLGMPRERM